MVLACWKSISSTTVAVMELSCLSLEKVDSQKAKRDVKLSNIEKRDVL